MILRIRKQLRRHRHPLVHGLVLLGLIPKFIVPVGYMPAALADGGPLMLCDGYPGIVLPGTDTGHAHAAASPAHHPTHAAVPHDQHASHGTAMAHADEPSTAGNAEDDLNAHGEWKRCSLGGLASLATIHHDWRIAIAPVAHELASTSVAIVDTRTFRVAFRSRAPPAPV